MMTFLHSRYNSRINFSPKEIFAISEQISREFAPHTVIDTPAVNSKTQLSSEEMLEISEEISRGFAPEKPNDSYGLVLLPVDPEHLHAYWSVDENPLDMTQDNDAATPLTLRVYSTPNKNIEANPIKSGFDVAINNVHAQQTITLPMRSDDIIYSASIGHRYPDNSLNAFASSNTVATARQKAAPYQKMAKPIALPKPIPQAITSPRDPAYQLNKNASGQSTLQ